MADNTTAHAAADYEREVQLTIPFHAAILDLAIEAALAAVPTPRRWLDTGCGPGCLVELARARSGGETRFVLADPSEAMLGLARQRLADLPAESFVGAGSHELPEIGPFDVITAVQCHHYYANPADHLAALRRCRALLRPGGALVTFENVRAETEAGHALQRKRWAAWQRARGREEEVVEAHLAREGTKFFPMRPSALAAHLAEAGFGTVELVWRAYGQAGFVAIAGE